MNGHRASPAAVLERASLRGALEALRAGRSVLFVLHDERLVPWLADVAVQECSATLEEIGSISFVSAHDSPARLRGLRFGHIEVHPAVYENGVVGTPLMRALNEHSAIVREPPREMTEAEAWTWLHDQGIHWFVRPSVSLRADERWCVEEDAAVIKKRGFYGLTPVDAIRAARRAKESR